MLDDGYVQIKTEFVKNWEENENSTTFGWTQPNTPNMLSSPGIV